MKTSFSWEILQIIITCFDCQKLLFSCSDIPCESEKMQCLASHGTIATSYNVYDLCEFKHGLMKTNSTELKSVSKVL